MAGENTVDATSCFHVSTQIHQVPLFVRNVTHFSSNQSVRDRRLATSIDNGLNDLEM